MPTALEQLQRLRLEHGDDCPLDLGAALIACVEQGKGPASASAMLLSLDELAAGLHLPEGASVFEQVARLNHHLFQDLGFQGDSRTYDDPRNSCLDQVLIRRKGLPILLSLVYIEVARRLGLNTSGLGFPGHFLVLPDCDPPFAIDPFHQGRVLRMEQLRVQLIRMFDGRLPGPTEEAQFLGPSPKRLVLVRVCNNLKNTHLGRGRTEEGLRILDVLQAIAPEIVANLRDRAVALQRLERIPEAIAAFEAYLEAAPDAADAAQVRSRLRRLKA